MQKAYISLSIDVFVNKIQFIVNITYFLFSFSYALLILSLAFFSAMVLRACTIPIDSYSCFLGFVLLEYLIRAYIQIEIQTIKIHII